MAIKEKKFRVEKDSLGELRVPAEAYYGIQTLRASRNFPISGTPPGKIFIAGTAMVKKAACLANLKLGLIDKKISRAIIKAADEIISGKFQSEFIVDVYQAGAGTSHNMNANEVIANRAMEILGGKPGDYRLVHPNDHVNMSQSTNDAMPTALRVAALISSVGLMDALKGLETGLKIKSREFDGIIKSGRTHLQDAVPIRLGQEFGSYAASVRSSIEKISYARERLKRIGLGGTAAGTGINTHPLYRQTVLRALREVSGINDLKKAPDPFEALNGAADYTAFSGALNDASVELIRISNDLRLLSSGPRTGLAEITLPAVQPGSSIMPGKVNPVMAEMLAMVCFQVIGNNLTVMMASQAGQLELNVMLPVINYNILHSIEILANAVKVFTEKCVKGIRADKERCRAYFENSVGLATVLNRLIGYEKASLVAKESAATGKTIKEVVHEKGIITEKEWDRLLDPVSITEPGNPVKKIKK